MTPGLPSTGKNIRKVPFRRFLRIFWIGWKTMFDYGPIYAAMHSASTPITVK
jgi:hypothetical protein